jgi:hypothetical protein
MTADCYAGLWHRVVWYVDAVVPEGASMFRLNDMRSVYSWEVLVLTKLHTITGNVTL